MYVLILGLLLVFFGTIGIIFFDAGVLIALSSFVVIGGAVLVSIWVRRSGSR